MCLSKNDLQALLKFRCTLIVIMSKFVVVASLDCMCINGFSHEHFFFFFVLKGRDGKEELLRGMGLSDF